MSMNEDRFAGTGKNVGGRVEQEFGRATGDVKTEGEGKIKQATGAAQDIYGQAKDAAGEAYEQAKMPLATQQGRCRNTLHRWKSFAQRYRKPAVYLGGCRAGPRLVHRPYGRTSDYWER